jgi:hypothetical protein
MPTYIHGNLTRTDASEADASDKLRDPRTVAAASIFHSLK